MGSTVARKRLEKRDESSDDSQWIVADDAPLVGWADSDAWFDTADKHVDLVSDAVIVAIPRRRVELHSSRNRDLVDGYSDEPDAPLERYLSWKSTEATITYGSGIPQPIAEVSDDELLW
jgi:hypothetical protein